MLTFVLQDIHRIAMFPHELHEFPPINRGPEVRTNGVYNFAVFVRAPCILIKWITGLKSWDLQVRYLAELGLEEVKIEKMKISHTVLQVWVSLKYRCSVGNCPTIKECNLYRYTLLYSYSGTNGSWMLHSFVKTTGSKTENVWYCQREQQLNETRFLEKIFDVSSYRHRWGV